MTDHEKDRVDTLEKYIETLRTEIKQLREERDQSQAREAVMRAALEQIKDRKPSDGVGFAILCGRYESIASQALSTDSGTSILDQFREMRTLLDLLKYVSAVSFSDWKNYDDWAKRREAVLEVSKGLV